MAVLAYHAIITAYGFWLPNDPRGSWSDYVRCWELARFGPATKVTTRRSLAGRTHDRQQRAQAKQALCYPPVVFSGEQAAAIGDGFKQAIDESSYTVHACTILPEHTHLVILRHRQKIELVVGHLKGRASHQLLDRGLHPLRDYRNRLGAVPSPWADHGWPVYLSTPADIRRAIAYVEQNPIKEGLPPQHWSFVTPYEG
jgi:REP element-mobilizing transposase RayT